MKEDLNPFDLTNYVTETFKGTLALSLGAILLLIFFAIAATPWVAVFLIINAITPEKDRRDTLSCVISGVRYWVFTSLISLIGFMVMFIAVKPADHVINIGWQVLQVLLAWYTIFIWGTVL